MASPLIYYVRHGETDWNRVGRLQGQRDIPLNATGRRQSEKCGEILRDLLGRDGVAPADLDFVSSPLGRARETMALVRAALGCEAGDYRLDARLAELSFGTWEGLTFEEVRRAGGAALAARERDRWHFAPPGGESYAQLMARVGAWHGSLTRPAIVTAHGGTARALMAHRGILTIKDAPGSPIDQGVVYVLAGNRSTRYG